MVPYCNAVSGVGVVMVPREAEMNQENFRGKCLTFLFRSLNYLKVNRADSQGKESIVQ